MGIPSTNRGRFQYTGHAWLGELGLRVEERIERFAQGKLSEKEFLNEAKAEGLGALVGLAVVSPVDELTVAGAIAGKVISWASKVSKGTTDITKAYKRPSGATTAEQRASVQGKPCVDCGSTTSKQVADHKKPLVKEYYETGTIDTIRMRSVDAVQPQCPTCSARQGAKMSRYSQQMKKELELD